MEQCGTRVFAILVGRQNSDYAMGCQDGWWEEKEIEGVPWGGNVTNVVTLMLEQDRPGPLVGWKVDSPKRKRAEDDNGGAGNGSGKKVALA